MHDGEDEQGGAVTNAQGVADGKQNIRGVGPVRGPELDPVRSGAHGHTITQHPAIRYRKKLINKLPVAQRQDAYSGRE
jgi:hypothetical protein